MKMIRHVAGEILGLLVDDFRLALLIVAWLLVMLALLPRLHLGGAVPGLLLYVGLVAALLESVWRRARQ